MNECIHVRRDMAVSLNYSLITLCIFVGLAATFAFFGGFSAVMGKGTAKPNLLPDKLVQQHVKCCQLKQKRCSLCAWAAKKTSWQDAVASPKWLRVCLRGKKARVGCTACALAECEGPWASFMQNPMMLTVHKLTRHEQSKTHKQAVEAQEGKSLAAFAPEEKEFQEVWKGMRAGGSARNGGVCSDKKAQMRWCLSEAALEKTRADLQGALSIAVCRDERKGKLLLRYRACRPDLTISCGVLGFEVSDPSSDALAKATRDAICALCQPLRRLPRGFVSRNKPVYDSEAEERIRNCTTILITDAAAPEMLASGLLAGKRVYATSGERHEYFRNVRVIGRDTAHATTRLLKKPFNSHPLISQVLEEYVLGKDSFAQKVWRSPMYTQWWRELVDEAGGEGCHSLAAAKHRFSSHLIPLTRICHNLPVMIRLCHKIATLRSESGRWAVQLLKTYSGFKAIVLGLAADAAASSMDFTRFCDQESADISELNSRAIQFGLSVETLFTHGKVFELPTFAKAMADSAAVDILIDGCARRVSVTNADKASALKSFQELCLVEFLSYFLHNFHSSIIS